jgi:hypothetical protein
MTRRLECSMPYKTIPQLLPQLSAQGQEVNEKD